jgi:hypothetical protein
MTPMLYHFSEEPDIIEFVPRPPLARPEQEALVWAVDSAHAWTYLFPRDCPRILIWPVASTTDEDRSRWFGRAREGRLACIEWAWLSRMHSTKLFRYSLPPDSYEPLPAEDVAWMFVSRTHVRPRSVEPVGDLVEALSRESVELRLMPSLAPLRDAWTSSMHVSGIRLRNAAGWPED